MNTIILQIEVTNFLCSAGSRKEEPVTLFGDQEERVKVAIKVMLANKSINDGFSLAFKIIQVKI